MQGNNGAFQNWIIENREDNTVSFRNQANGLYLDSNANGDAYTHAGNGDDSQRWTLS